MTRDGKGHQATSCFGAALRPVCSVYSQPSSSGVCSPRWILWGRFDLHTLKANLLVVFGTLQNKVKFKIKRHILTKCRQENGQELCRGKRRTGHTEPPVCREVNFISHCFPFLFLKTPLSLFVEQKLVSGSINCSSPWTHNFSKAASTVKEN